MTLPLQKIGCISAIGASSVALGLHNLCSQKSETMDFKQLFHYKNNIKSMKQVKGMYCNSTGCNFDETECVKDQPIKNFGKYLNKS